MQRLVCIIVVMAAWCSVAAMAGQLRDDLAKPQFVVVPFYGYAVPCSPTGIGRAWWRFFQWGP